MTDIAPLARSATAAAIRGLGRAWRFAWYVGRRFDEDGCLAAAGALSYTTLVSLVPLLAISLAVFSAFPIFDRLRGEALGFVFDSFVPRIGGTVEGYISNFAASAGKTTALGVIVLAVTAIMLLATIESRLDAVWRVHAPRSWLARITIYWTLLTLGPLIFGLALSISTSLHVTAGDLGTDSTAASLLGQFQALARFVPVLLQSVGLSLFYCLIPHCTVRWRDGLVGGVAAGALLELCRFGFTLFIDNYNSYEPIYGALAVIPIFLLWMYLSWTVVMIGAEIAAALPLWGVDEALDGAPETTEFELALRLLEILADPVRQGQPPRLPALALRAEASTGRVGTCLSRLGTAGLVAATLDGGFVLVRDLEHVTLGDAQKAVAGQTPPRHRQTRLDRHLAPMRAAEAEALAMPVARYLAGHAR